MGHPNASKHQQAWRLSHPQHRAKQNVYQAKYLKRLATWKQISKVFLRILL